MTLLNWDRLAEFYDFTSGERMPMMLSVPDLANRLIHSYVFASLQVEAGHPMIAFSSDRRRNSELLGLDLSLLVGMYKLVALDDLGSISAAWDDSIQDYRIKVGEPMQDPEVDRAISEDVDIRGLLANCGPRRRELR